jgi:hypothetical protein
MSGMQPAAHDDGPLNVLPHRDDRDSSLLETDLVAVVQRLLDARERLRRTMIKKRPIDNLDVVF